MEVPKLINDFSTQKNTNFYVIRTIFFFFFTIYAVQKGGEATAILTSLVAPLVQLLKTAPCLYTHNCIIIITTHVNVTFTRRINFSNAVRVIGTR